MDTALPLSLQILRMVQAYRKIPRGLLYDKLAASNSEIDARLKELDKEGAVKVEKDSVIAK